MNDIIERINSVMKEKGIKPAELARRTGIDRSSISHYLSGDYSPKIDKIEKIADAIGVTVSYLVGFSDDPSPTGDPDLDKIADMFTRMTQPGSFGPVTVSDDEMTVVMAYRHADPAIQAAVRKLLDIEKGKKL